MAVSLRELLDPCRISDEEARAIARQRCAQRESFGVELARYTTEYLRGQRIDTDAVERSFSLIEMTAEPAQFFSLLRSALTHDDAAVRALAISVLARGIPYAGWMEKLGSDNDERVRAGSIEALWRQTGPDVEQALVSATQDASETVAAKAVYGLYLMDPERHIERLRNLAAHPVAAFRCAAAALIAKVDPSVRGRLLKPLLTDVDPLVRRAAFGILTTMKGGGQAAA